VAGFIHLEKHHHRHATDHLVGQEDVDVTVTEVEGSVQPRRIRAELPEQCIGGLAPMGLTADLFESDLREDWATVQNDRKRSSLCENTSIRPGRKKSFFNFFSLKKNSAVAAFGKWAI
jgi:hypothetical protein